MAAVLLFSGVSLGADQWWERRRGRRLAAAAATASFVTSEEGGRNPPPPSRPGWQIVSRLTFHIADELHRHGRAGSRARRPPASQMPINTSASSPATNRTPVRPSRHSRWGVAAHARACAQGLGESRAVMHVGDGIVERRAASRRTPPRIRVLDRRGGGEAGRSGRRSRSNCRRAAPLRGCARLRPECAASRTHWNRRPAPYATTSLVTRPSDRPGRTRTAAAAPKAPVPEAGHRAGSRPDEACTACFRWAHRRAPPSGTRRGRRAAPQHCCGPSSRRSTTIPAHTLADVQERPRRMSPDHDVVVPAPHCLPQRLLEHGLRTGREREWVPTAETGGCSSATFLAPRGSHPYRRRRPRRHPRIGGASPTTGARCRSRGDAAGEASSWANTTTRRTVGEPFEHVPILCRSTGARTPVPNTDSDAIQTPDSDTRFRHRFRHPIQTPDSDARVRRQGQTPGSDAQRRHWPRQGIICRWNRGSPG